VRIARIGWVRFDLPFHRQFQTAHGPIATRSGVLLRLQADDGTEGFGEAAPLPGFGGEPLAAVLAGVQDLGPKLVGRSLAEAAATATGLVAARPALAFALDTALHDLRAQGAAVPVARLLGGDPTRPVPINAVIGDADPADAAAAARRAADAGFGCVKLKVGVAGAADAEVARVGAVRAALGPSRRLRLDANEAWTVEAAIAIIRAAEPFDLELVEQPVDRRDLTGLARVRAALGVPIAADEAVGTVANARAVIAAGAADVLVVKPMLAGGLGPARDLIDLATAAGLRALVTTTLDGGVGVAAALHLAAALPSPALASGLATASLLAADLLQVPLAVDAGTMRVPPLPGLGVRLDPAQVQRYGGTWREIPGDGSSSQL
jgi:o-succinylbenzoate synthase